MAPAEIFSTALVDGPKNKDLEWFPLPFSRSIAQGIVIVKTAPLIYAFSDKVSLTIIMFMYILTI